MTYLHGKTLAVRIIVASTVAIVNDRRDVEITFRRAMPTEEIFEHDHLPRSILFDSRLPTKSETSQLVNLKIVHWQHFGTKLKLVIPKSV